MVFRGFFRWLSRRPAELNLHISKPWREAIHQGDDPAQKLVSIVCGALVPDLMESTLFGLRKGSFAGDHGKGGLASPEPPLLAP